MFVILVEREYLAVAGFLRGKRVKERFTIVLQGVNDGAQGLGKIRGLKVGVIEGPRCHLSTRLPECPLFGRHCFTARNHALAKDATLAFLKCSKIWNCPHFNH